MCLGSQNLPREAGKAKEMRIRRNKAIALITLKLILVHKQEVFNYIEYQIISYLMLNKIIMLTMDFTKPSYS